MITALNFIPKELMEQVRSFFSVEYSSSQPDTLLTLSKYRKSIKAWEFGYGNAIFEIFKKKTYGKEVLLDGV